MSKEYDAFVENLRQLFVILGKEARELESQAL